MPVMTFDLEDGKAPITIRLDANDGERFMAFLDDCQKQRTRNESVGDCDECERHIQEVDASRDRITQLEAALLVAREAILAFKLPADSIIGAQGGNLLLRVPIDTIQKQAAAITAINSVGVAK